MLKKLKILFGLLFLFVSFMAKAETINEDFILTLKESFLSKAFVNQRNFEYKDNQGNYLKLSNLKLSLDDGFIKGSVNLDKFKQNHYTNNSVLDGLIRKVSEMDNVAVVKLKTEIGLSKDHQKLILKNTKFTSFDNKYLPAFIEQTFVLGELNRRFSSQINGQTVYKFSDNSQVDIYDLQIAKKGIQIKGILK
jgi:hypothetical protein